MKISNPYAQHPPRWLDYRQNYVLAHHVFKSAATVNRFGARYRLAKAFKSIELDGYHAATVNGYCSLTRLMLAWGAFEGLLIAIGKTKHDLEQISSRYDYAGLLKELGKSDPERRFFSFVRENIHNKNQKGEVQKFITGQPCCGLTLAKSVRHIFVHGLLTPSANQTEPTLAAAVCEQLTFCLFKVMDREFTERLQELLGDKLSFASLSDEDFPPF